MYDINLVKTTPKTKKPRFYMDAYLVDIICSSFNFPLMKWYYNDKTPPIHIYCVFSVGIKF